MTPFVGFTFGGDTTIADIEHAADNVHRQFGGAVTVLGGGMFGAESVFVYTPGMFSADGGVVEGSRSLAWMGNVVLTAPRRWTEYGLRPFVSGGLGLLRTTVDEAVLPVTSNLLGFNVGGGAIGFLSRRIGLRFDLRYYSNVHRTQDTSQPAVDRLHLRYFTASVGIVFRKPAAGYP